MSENMILTSYSDESYFVVMRQVETPSKRTDFVVRQIYLVARCYFYVASVVTLYHGCKTSKCCDRCFLVLLPVKYCDMLHGVVLHSSGI